MAEGDHAGVADQDVGGHRQQTPDQYLGEKLPPELRQYQSRHEQQGEDNGKSRPIDERPSSARPSLTAPLGGSLPLPLRGEGAGVRSTRWREAHFGVGTKSPVGRNSRVKISTTNETMTAWAGLTHSDAYASNNEIKIEAAIEPARLPIPPTTTTIKAFKIQSSPIAWLTPTSGPNNTPLAAAIPAPIANTTIWTQSTSTAMTCAMNRALVVA